jgi:hypothetical protein
LKGYGNFAKRPLTRAEQALLDRATFIKGRLVRVLLHTKVERETAKRLCNRDMGVVSMFYDGEPAIFEFRTRKPSLTNLMEGKQRLPSCAKVTVFSKDDE